MKAPSGGLDRRRPRHRRVLLVALLITVGAFSGSTARLFIWPRQGMPGHVSAIVMLDGPGDRLTTALDLAWAHRAPMIVISRGSPRWGHGSVCAPKIAGVRVICFDPDPGTTAGEAEFAGRLARRYHWRSVALVAIAPQDAVARIRLARCFSGRIYLVNAPLAVWQWPQAIAHGWGAAVKALLVQRSC